MGGPVGGIVFTGVFAAGQVYVLWSRVTNPLHFHLVGLPPMDMLDEVAKAWQDAGMDVNKCLRRAVEVTGDWLYTDAANPKGQQICFANHVTPSTLMTTPSSQRCSGFTGTRR